METAKRIVLAIHEDEHQRASCIRLIMCPSPGIPAFVAQRIEHLTTDQKVGGSSPSKRTKASLSPMTNSSLSTQSKKVSVSILRRKTENRMAGQIQSSHPVDRKLALQKRPYSYQEVDLLEQSHVVQTTWY